MKLLHKKSQCCGAKIVRFGAKRRQCIVCRKTWRVRPAKRGRKILRQQRNCINKVFNHGFSVKQLTWHSNLSVDVVYKRFAKNLDSIVSQKRLVRIRGQKLILIIDAKWQYFKSNLWTLYFVSAKSTSSKKVVVFDPILQPGKENCYTWNSIFNQLPLSVRKRVIALVSDGIRGIETIALNNNWIIQRCHFHLLSALQKMRGKRASTHGRLIRETVFQLVKSALSETSKRKLNILCHYLNLLAGNEQCPAKMKMIVRDFLRRLPEFRNYLKYPQLNLPTTVNVMESINSLVARKTKTASTPKSWHQWATACIRFKPKFNCK